MTGSSIRTYNRCELPTFIFYCSPLVVGHAALCILLLEVIRPGLILVWVVSRDPLLYCPLCCPNKTARALREWAAVHLRPPWDLGLMTQPENVFPKIAIVDLISVVSGVAKWTLRGVAVMEECEKRWRFLRDRFAREKKKRKGDAESLEAQGKTDPWPFFRSMNFLSPFVSERRPIPTLPTIACVMAMEDTCSVVGIDAQSCTLESPSLPICMSTPPLTSDSQETQNMESSPECSPEVNEITVPPCIETIGTTPDHEYSSNSPEVSHSGRWTSNACKAICRLLQTTEEQMKMANSEIHPLEHYIRGLTKFYDRLQPETQLLFQTKTTQLLLELCQNESAFLPVQQQDNH